MKLHTFPEEFRELYVWFASPEDRVKLEIGSTVRPDPYSKKTVKTYIHEFLEERGFIEDAARFELSTVEINTLNIERTFIDKIMSVKRHAICGTLDHTVRHIYDGMFRFPARTAWKLTSLSARLM